MKEENVILLYVKDGIKMWLMVNKKWYIKRIICKKFKFVL